MASDEAWAHPGSQLRLVRLVREGIERLGDPRILVPPASSYKSGGKSPFFSLDIDFGGDFILACESTRKASSVLRPRFFDDMASAILDRIAAAARQRVALSDMIRRTVKLGERAIRASRTSMAIVKVRIQTLSLEEEYFLSAKFGTVVALQILDDCLKPNVVRFSRRNPREIAREIRGLATQQRKCEARLGKLDRIGADFEIDVIALTAMSPAGLDPGFVYTRIIADGIMFEAPSIRLPTGREHSPIFVMDCGRLISSFALTDDVRVSWSSLEIPNSLPATVLLHLKGRSVRDVVDHPALHGDIRIAGVEQHDDHITLRLKVPTIPVRLGSVGDAPTASTTP